MQYFRQCRDRGRNIMFAGFNLETTKDYSMYYETGKKLFDVQRRKVEEDLDKFLDPDGTIDGTKLANNWFPQIKADIFISHSHKDEKQAIGLAGWLWEKFQLATFIDSCVWGYADRLLKRIDNRFCQNDGEETYSYEKRNHSTAHVHMMLNVALCRMIDKTECVFLFNTPNSITCSEAISNTNSSWIYSEVVMTEIIRKRELSRYRDGQVILFEKKAMNQQMEFKYELTLDHLELLNDQDIQRWENKSSSILRIQEVVKISKIYPLDYLYNIKGILK